MQSNKVTDAPSVSSQITPQDMAEIRDAEFRDIICNWPDSKGADEPNFEEIEAAATAAGIEAHYLPVTSGMVRDSETEAFGQALLELPGPVLAYCRSGTRSATLWSLAPIYWKAMLRGHEWMARPEKVAAKAGEAA